MLLVPNSWGSLREFNPCHDPKDGKFAPKGLGNCSGELSDPGRNRAIFGQMVPDDQGLAFDQKEAAHANVMLVGVGGESAAKDAIAKKLAESLVDHPGLAALHAAGGFMNRYSVLVQSTTPSPTEAVAQYHAEMQHEAKKFGVDPEMAEANDYQSFLQEFEPEVHGPDPEDAQQEYEEYRDETDEHAYEEASNAAWDEATKEFEREGDKLADEAESSYDDAAEAFSEARNKAAVDAINYGDPSLSPALPGFDLAAPTDKYSLTDIISQWDEDGVDAEFLHDPAYLANGVFPAFDKDTVLEGTEFDPNDDNARQKYGESFTEDLNYESDAMPFDDWYEDKYGFDPDEYSEKMSPPSFEDWYKGEYGIAPEDWVPADQRPEPVSFPTWYFLRHGIHPDEWKAPAGSSDAENRLVMARNVASGLVEAWAATSSDSDLRSLGMQITANQHFGLGATYAQSLTAQGKGMLHEAEKFASTHGPVLSTFLQAMYTNTQQWVKDNNIGTNGYVTLYRGWSARSPQEPGLPTMNLKEGSPVDVLLQPLSAFSARFSTASGFSTSGGADTPIIMAVRVPTNRLIGSARTGFGCLSEAEFVVLGGRYPSFMMSYNSNRGEEHLLAQALLRIPRKYPVAAPLAGDRY